ncbi:hypothetical protein MASR1M59_08680 [Melaminivora sp.]|jgi:hypothetical protein
MGLCALAGPLVLACWGLLAAGHPGGWPRLFGAALLWLACAGLAWRSWQALPVGMLVWDGSAWWLMLQSGASIPLAQAPAVRLDWQQTLLLQAAALQGRGQWLWLQADANTLDWQALRRALYGRSATMPAPDAAEPAQPPPSS